MSKVLIICPSFHYFPKSIERAFKNLGWDTMLETYDEPIHPNSLFNRLLYKCLSNKERLVEKSRKRWKTYIEQQYISFNPDLVFIIKGINLLPETVRFFHQHSKIVLWMYDSITRYDNRLGALVPEADFVFCYEKKDIDWCKQYCNNVNFLAQAEDETIYKPLNIEKDIDILFVGGIYKSPKRQKILNVVITHFPTRKIVFYGIYKPWYKNPIKWLFREHRKIFKNHDIDSNQVNEYYNRAHVVLNVHREQQSDGANPKVFEICGSKAIQVCDANPYITSVFSKNEIELYHNDEELITAINRALEEDKTTAVEEAYNIVLGNHTFTKRIEYLLSIIKL